MDRITDGRGPQNGERLPGLEALREAVKARVGQQRFDLWFGGQGQFLVHPGQEGWDVRVLTRNLQCQDWLEHAFGEAVRSAAAEVLGESTQVRWQVDPQAFDDAPADATPCSAPLEASRVRRSDERLQTPSGSTPTPRSAQAASPLTSPSSSAKSPPHDLFGEPMAAPPLKRYRRTDDETSAVLLRSPARRRWKSLDEFVTGPCNRVAHAAAVNLIEQPTPDDNPLVIHGPVGTGKTHLLEGIHLGLRKHRPDLRPCYVTAEEFTNRFVQAMRVGKMALFRRQYRECSALLLDDLHFLVKRRATQVEFLHTLDALSAEGRPVVVSMDCHPRLAEELMPELTDRLLGGVVWGVMPPDEPTRLAILRQKAGRLQALIPDEVLAYVAATLRGNVRELEGALNGLRHYARVSGRPIDCALAKEALGDLIRHSVRVVTMPEVESAVCAVLRLPPGALQSRCRSAAAAYPRMIAAYLCRKHTTASYGEISKFLAARTHSTAVSSEKKVRTWLEQDMTIVLGERQWRAKEVIERIERELLK